MTDVFDRLLGQERVVGALRRYAVAPVHAYLFHGPGDSSVRDAMVTFAAALQCPEHGCGSCEACRRVLAHTDPDVHVVERSGAAWRIEEIRDAERVARRRPLGAGFQIVIIEDVELTTTGAVPSASALLKTLEEPPDRTVFLLGAHELTPGLETIISRCLDVRLRPLSDLQLIEILVREGAPAQVASDAARAASGNLRRARVLVRDDDLSTRLAQWRSVPERLNGACAASALVAQELSLSLDAALAPLRQVQDEEMSRREDDAREMGWRSVTNRRDVDAQFKREQRRFRQEELRFGLTVLTEVYRERLLENLEAAGPRPAADPRSDYRVGASLRAIDAVTSAYRHLATNVDESLLLHDLMLTLMAY